MTVEHNPPENQGPGQTNNPFRHVYLQHKENQHPVLFLKPARSLLILTPLIIVSLFASGVVPARASNFQPHAPILINGNSGFTQENGVVGGIGTSSEPYVIEGWEIASAPEFGIQVHNTSAYFVIRNVYVHDGAPSSYLGEGFGGISLNRVTNVVLENLTISKTNNAITAIESQDVRVANNLVVSNHNGIFTFHSSNVRISGNNLSLTNGWGIWSSFSRYVVISGNNFDHNGIGIVTYNGGTVIVGNTLSNNDVGIGLLYDYGPTHNNFINNNDQSYSSCGHFPGCVYTWDDGYPSGGNYWSDFSAVDNCSGPNQDICNGPDGVADKPLVMGNTAIDRYPLTKPFAPAVSGKVRFEPASITSENADKYLTAFVRFPRGFEKSDLVSSSIRLNGTIAAASGAIVSRSNGAGVLVVRFNMTQVRALLSKPGNYTLQVSANLLTATSFRPFEATATIRLLPQ